MTMPSHQATPVCAYGGDVDGLGATEYFSNHTNAEPTHQLQHAYYGGTSYDAPSYTHQHSYDHSYDSTFQVEADQSTTTSASPYIKQHLLPNVFSLAQKLIPAALRRDKKKTLDCYDDFEGLCSLPVSSTSTWNTSYSTTQEINSNSTWLEYKNNHNRDTSYYGSADNVEAVEGGGTMAWGSNNGNYGATKTDLQRTPSVELPVGYLSVIGNLPSFAGAYKKNESPGNGVVLVGSRPMIRMNTFEKEQRIHKGMSSNDNPQDGTASAVATKSNSTSQHDLENVDISTEDACDEVPIIRSPLQSSASFLESPTDGSQPFYNVLFGGIGDDDSSDTNLEEMAPLPESQAEEAQSFHDVLFGLGEDCESTTQTSLQATSTDETSQPFWTGVWTHVIARVAYWRK